MSEGSTSPVYRKSSLERRETVLDAAVVEFAEKGLHGASTEGIAERAGISQPYVFKLFGTKKGLFLSA
ncbi:MAG: TetR/AcrR family transcriptional regulator, partial [Rubrobacter sp.]